MKIDDSLKTVPVTALEMAQPVVLDAQTTTRAVITQLRQLGRGCALLTTDGKLAGIFTERDILHKVMGNDAVLDKPVAELMTPDPVSITEKELVSKAIFEMHTGGFRHVAVVDADNVPVSCVRHKDVIRYLVEHSAGHSLNLPPEPEQQATAREGG